MFGSHKKNPLDWMQVGNKSEGLSAQLNACRANYHRFGKWETFVPPSKEGQTEAGPWPLTCRILCVWSFREMAGPNLTDYLSVVGGLQDTSMPILALMAGLQSTGGHVHWKPPQFCAP